MIHAQWKLDLSPLKRLQKGQKKIVRQAVRQVMKDIKDQTEAEASKHIRFGFLADAWGLKVKTYRRDIVVGIVGPKSKLQYTYGTFVRGKRKGEPKIAAPSKYEHFFETGVKGKFSPRPILKPILDKLQAEFADKIATLIREGIARVLGDGNIHDETVLE